MKAAVGVFVGLAMAASASAQSGAAAEPLPARHEIVALEGVLENAVRYGAQMLNLRLQKVAAPDIVLLAGASRARGFRLEGYGVLFDVEFPSIRRSVIWSMRMLERRASAPRAGVAAASTDPSRAASKPTQPPAAELDDPSAIYVSEITTSLVDAMLEHGGPVGVGPDEWLTVAARESLDRGLVPDDPSEPSMSFVLRIKGSDLTALRERRLTREEARQRVEIKQN